MLQEAEPLVVHSHAEHGNERLHSTPYSLLPTPYYDACRCLTRSALPVGIDAISFCVYSCLGLR
jgi:hypothetical protein